MNIEELLNHYYPDSEPIAVIGYACRFPEAEDSDAFWANLKTGRECGRQFSRQELLEVGIPVSIIDDPAYIPRGTVIADADTFDAELFGYSRQEAELIDPQQRLFLQVVWHALEHAGYSPREVTHKTGVFAAERISTYPGREAIDIAKVAHVRSLQSLMGNDKDYIATRVAYKLDLRGPAMTVQTACSSSLVATHIACESLRSGECDMVVAGGAALSFPQGSGYLYQPGMIFSPDGFCRPFDAQAQGTYAGNGVGAVVMRRLADALRDGDPVAAVVLGSAINNDGSQKVGYTAPSVAGQRDVIAEAWSLASIKSQQIGMLEAHGTATPLGDSIELQALHALFHDRDQGPPCALGSVKSNMGHLDTAAGIASLLKTVLAVEHGIIPPCVNFKQANPSLHLDDGPFHVPTQAQLWNADVRTAGVSSFGIGGTNCHMVVASLPQALRQHVEVNTDVNGTDETVLLFSANSEKTLRHMAGSYAQALQKSPIEDICYTALQGRPLDLPWRLAVPVCEESVEALAAFADGQDDILIHFGHDRPGKQVWLFTGQGSQWPGMAKTWCDYSAVFARYLDRCLKVFETTTDRFFGDNLRKALLETDHDLFQHMEYAQPAIVVFELAMAAHWQDQGLVPDGVLGHSVGDFAAAVVAGYYTPEQVIPLIRLRGALMDRCAGGAMLSVYASESEVMPMALNLGLDLAVYNGERHLVFSGERKAVAQMSIDLESLGVRSFPLAVTGAAHSRGLDPILDEFQLAMSGLQAQKGVLPFICGLTAEVVNEEVLNEKTFWRRHMRSSVRFIQCLSQATNDGAGLFIEMGPDSVLASIGRRELGDQAANWIACAKRQQSATHHMQQVLMQLFAEGLNLPWSSLLCSSGHKCHGPLYPFERQRYWGASFAAFPAKAAEHRTLLPEARGFIAREGHELDLPRLQNLYTCATKLHGIYVKQLVRRCVGEHDTRLGVSALDILRRGRILPRYNQLLVRLLNTCVQNDAMFLHEGRYGITLAPDNEQVGSLLHEMKGYCEGLDIVADTVQRAGECLYDMMTGETDPLSVIFPEGESSGVEALYQDFSFGRYFNQILARVVADLLHDRTTQSQNRPTFRVLEVGGGTGGTTSWVLPALCEQPNVCYVFTDISPIFTRRAEQKFATYGFIQYREFDLQKDPAAQGFDAGHYDLIIAANVLHATQHIGKTLTNLLPLLTPGGKLVMREITRPMCLFDFVFGPLVLPLQDEEARGGELFLSTARWREHCLAAGFEKIEWLPEDGTLTSDMGEHIVIATSPGGPLMQTEHLRLGDKLLGQPLTNGGDYLTDWSDCAGHETEWMPRVNAACVEMSRRHGSGQPVLLTNAPALAPKWLSLVRLRWHASPGKSPWVELSTLDPEGRWLTAFAPDTVTEEEAPLLTATPETQYDWVWERTDFSERQPSRIKGPFRILGHDVESVTASLAEAGLSSDPGARDAILVLDPSGTLDALAIAVREVISEAGLSRIVVVTREAWRVAGYEDVNAVQHAVWGLMRTAAVELAKQQSGCCIAMIDLDSVSIWEDLKAGLQALTNGESWVAIRQGNAWTPRLIQQQYAAPALTEESLSGNGWHLITGGLGDLGRLSAKWLVSRGARRIALLILNKHRDGAAFLASIQQRHHDSTIICHECDVASPTALEKALHRFHLDGGIAGVIHAAGILDDGPFTSLRSERLASVLAVKSEAARQIYHYLKDTHTAAYLLLYSSAAAALGSAGQAAHTFASAYLDGLAYASSGRGSDQPIMVVSIAWGAWRDAGQAALGPVRDRLEAEGMGVLSNAEGLWHLEQAFSRRAPFHLAMRVLPEHLDETRLTLLGLKQRVSEPLEGPLHISAPSNKQSASSASLLPIQFTDPVNVSHWLTVQIATQLRIDDTGRVSPTRDLIQLGLDSLLFLELNSAIQRCFDVRIDPEKAYQDLTIKGLAQLIVAQTSNRSKNAVPIDSILHDEAGRFQPFPLTPIQHAYWMGRTNVIGYGGVACHVLFEWDLRHDQFDLPRLEKAWNALVRRHDMLRMVIDEDGLQHILAEVPEYKITRHNLIAFTDIQRQQALDERRRDLSYRVLPAERWPLFELIASEIDQQRYRLHMNLDLLLFDVQSFKVMMDDLSILYRGESPEPLQITFRDYVLNEQANRLTPGWLKSWSYWQTRIADLPPSPHLPMSGHQQSGQPHFTTYQAALAPEVWGKLKREWQSWGVTPSAALLTIFALILERWARWPAFTLNLTFFNRRQVHPQIQRLIGDFTSVLLVDFDFGDSSLSLRDDIEQTQHRLRQHLAHSQVNGVELLRELGRQRGQSCQPLMPVVFTSMLGMTLDGLEIDQAMTSLLGSPINVFTQTPQVWLDHQVMEIGEKLVFSWYCMDGVLAEGVAAAMFNDFHDTLEAFAHHPNLMERNGLWRRSKEQQSELNVGRHKWHADIRGLQIDLREIEDAARQQDGVLLAEARVTKEQDSILVNVVASQSTYELAGSPLFFSDSLGLMGLNAVEQADFDEVWNALETRALHGIAMTLSQHGMFIRPGQTVKLEDIYEDLAVMPQFKRIIRQWLSTLVHTGWITQENQDYSCKRSLTLIPAPRSFSPHSWGDVLANYLDRCVEKHTQLLQGTCSALELFFVDDYAVTRTLYAENPAARCVYRQVVTVLRALFATLEPGDKLQVMEVGAGTGAFTGAVLEGLCSQLLSYHFTDVSTFFLDDARRRFAQREDIVYALFDLNQPVDYRLHPADGYDLVIAAQVMHDACHIVRSLRRIASLMKPGARLLLIEATQQDSLLQMASVGFIEGLGNYQDLRIADDRAMLSLDQWREALKEAGFAFELACPDSTPSPIHQHVIVARMERAAKIDCDKVAFLLNQQFGHATLRVIVQQCEQMSLYLTCETLDNKPKVSPRPSPPISTAPIGVPGHDALINAVAQVWQSLLGKGVDTASDFFGCGGDSLIATRVISTLNRIGIKGASLQTLFDHPNLSDFCSKLTHKAEELRANTLVPLTDSPSGKALFVFHASDGGVTSYLKFAHALTGQVWGIQAPEMIAANSLSELAGEYLSAMPLSSIDEPYTLIGWSYGATVATEVAHILQDRGQHVRLVLIDPVCGEDFTVQDLTELMCLMAREHNLVLPDDWPKWEQTVRIETFISCVQKAGLINRALTFDAARQWLLQIYRLLNLLSQHRVGPPITAPVLWIEADQHPKHWNRSGSEWKPWKDAAQTRVVHATHWQLMQDSDVTAYVASLVVQWLTESSPKEQIQ